MILLVRRSNSSLPKPQAPFAWQDESASASHDTCAVPLFWKLQGHDERKAVPWDSISLSTSDCYLWGVPCELLQSFNSSLKPCLAVMLMKLDSRHSQGEGSASQDKCSSNHWLHQAPCPPNSLPQCMLPGAWSFKRSFQKKRPPSFHQWRESGETRLPGVESLLGSFSFFPFPPSHFHIKCLSSSDTYLFLNRNQQEGQARLISFAHSRRC